MFRKEGIRFLQRGQLVNSNQDLELTSLSATRFFRIGWGERRWSDPKKSYRYKHVFGEAGHQRCFPNNRPFAEMNVCYLSLLDLHGIYHFWKYIVVLPGDLRKQALSA